MSGSDESNENGQQQQQAAAACLRLSLLAIHTLHSAHTRHVHASRCTLCGPLPKSAVARSQVKPTPHQTRRNAARHEAQTGVVATHNIVW